MAKTAMFLNMILMLSLLLAIYMVEATKCGPGGCMKVPHVPLVCTKPYSVVSGDICFNILKTNNLTNTEFLGINPGLNCRQLFVGQWICLAGHA